LPLAPLAREVGAPATIGYAGENNMHHGTVHPGPPFSPTPPLPAGVVVRLSGAAQASVLELDRWLNHLQLRDPQIFLPRLATVVEALVGDKWWFDRDVLRARLPD